MILRQYWFPKEYSLFLNATWETESRNLFWSTQLPLEEAADQF